MILCKFFFLTFEKTLTNVSVTVQFLLSTVDYFFFHEYLCWVIDIDTFLLRAVVIIKLLRTTALCFYFRHLIFTLKK